MKSFFLSLFLALGLFSLAVWITTGSRLEARREARLGELEARLRSCEAELREGRQREAAAAGVLRGCVARGEALVGRLREIDGRSGGSTGAADPAGEFVSRAELDEVVSAVNEIVDAVDVLTAKAALEPPTSPTNEIFLPPEVAVWSDQDRDGDLDVSLTNSRQGAANALSWSARKGFAQSAPGQLGRIYVIDAPSQEPAANGSEVSEEPAQPEEPPEAPEPDR